MNNQRIQKFSPDGKFLLAFGDREEGRTAVWVWPFRLLSTTKTTFGLLTPLTNEFRFTDPDGNLIRIPLFRKAWSNLSASVVLKMENTLLPTESDDLVKRYGSNVELC